MILGAATTWDWDSFEHPPTYTNGQVAMIASNGQYYTLYNGVVRTAEGGAVYTFPTAGNSFSPIDYQSQRPCAHGDWFYLARVFLHEVASAFSRDYYLYYRFYAYNPVLGQAATIYSNADSDTKSFSWGNAGRACADVAVDPVTGIGLVIMDGYESYGGGDQERLICGTFTAGDGATAPTGFSTTGLLNTTSGTLGHECRCSAWNGVGYVYYHNGSIYLYRVVADLSAPSLSTVISDISLGINPTGPNLVSTWATDYIRQYSPATRLWDVDASGASSVDYLGEDDTYWYIIVIKSGLGYTPKVYALNKTADTVVEVGDYEADTDDTWQDHLGWVANGMTASVYNFPIRSIQPVRTGSSAYGILSLPIMEVF